MKYQNTNQLPKYTSRKDFIKAGYDVDCVWQPVGNVTVQNGQNVTFQAGGYVERLPGFNVELGGVFYEYIHECGDVPTNALNDTNLLGFTNGVFFTCDGAINNAGFASTGFSYYRVRIFNRWGEKVYDMMGHIDEIYTVYTSGDDIYTDISQGEFTVQLELFNCSYSKLVNFSLFYEYVDPCLSASFKTEHDDDFKKSDAHEMSNSEEVQLYPNPASSELNLVYTTTSNQLICLEIHNQIGQAVYYRDKIPVTNKRQLHVISLESLASGIYFLTLYKDGNKYVNKFVVEK